MLSVHLKSGLYIVGIKVAYVTSLTAARAALKLSALSRSSTRVCSEVCPHRCNVCICALQVSLRDSVAPHNTSVRLLELFFMHSHLFSTSCWNFVLPPCTFQLPSIQSAVDPACSCSIILSPTHSSQDHVPALGVRVLFQCSIRASHRRPSLLVRFHSCKVTHRRLHCHMASVPMQHHRIENRQRTATQTRTHSSGISVLTVYTHLSQHLKS